MADQINFSLGDTLEKLGKSLESVADYLKEEANQAIKDVSYAVFADIQAKAQSKLNSTRADYLKGLDITDLGDNGFLISLNGEQANRIEDGWASFVQNEKMLNSNKTVGVGSRAGQAWVKHTKATKNKPSHKYAHVPFEHHPFSKATKNADMAAAIKAMTATNAQGIEQKLTQIFKDEAGNPLTGKVAVGRSDNPLLDQMVKYQHKYVDSQGKESTQSTYMTFRTISETGKAWVNGGYAGAHLFDDADALINKHFEAIINQLFGG